MSFVRPNKDYDGASARTMPMRRKFPSAPQMLESYRETFAQVIQPALPRSTSRLFLYLGKVAGMHAARYRFDPCVGTYSN